MSTQRPDVTLERYDHMDRVETSDGEFRVLVSARTGERQLVRADVVEYDSLLEHPMVQGAAGFIGVLLALLAPAVAGFFGGATLGGSVLHLAGGVFVGSLVGIIGANVVLEKTTLGAALWRFLEWYDVKHLVLRGDGA